jgi:hypothetical protein
MTLQISFPDDIFVERSPHFLDEDGPVCFFSTNDRTGDTDYERDDSLIYSANRLWFRRFSPPKPISPEIYYVAFVGLRSTVGHNTVVLQDVGCYF